MTSRRAAVVFGVADVVASALVLFGVFVALPARWWPIDAGAGVLAALLLAAGGSLLAGVGGAGRLAWVVAALVLLVGLALVTSLGVTASWLAGVYGSVGRGGAVVLVLVAALALPYLVVGPAIQVVWLWPRDEGERESDGEGSGARGP